MGVGRNYSVRRGSGDVIIVSSGLPLGPKNGDELPLLLVIYSCGSTVYNFNRLFLKIHRSIYTKLFINT